MIVVNSQPHTLITGSSDVDTIDNTGSNVTINAGWGNDSITHAADHSSINGGFGNDFVFISSGAQNTVKGFDGNDTISLGADSSHNLLEYAYYDDNDLIIGLRAEDSIKIIGSAASNITVPSDNDVRLRVDSSVVTLRGAASFNLIGTGYRDTIRNLRSSMTIDAGDDDDTINNFASNVAMFGGNGNDSILINSGINSTINAGDGDDTISLRGSGNLIDYTTGKDIVLGYRSNDTIRLVDARDFTVRADAPNVFVTTDGDEVTLRNATLINLIGSDKNNSIVNQLSNSTINGGAGADSIVNLASLDALNGGDGNDTIINRGSKVTIVGSDGNDSIEVAPKGEVNYVLLRYDGAEGNDTVTNFSRHDTLFLASGAVLDRHYVGSNFVVSLDGGSITFKNVGKTPIRTLNADGRHFAVNYDVSNYGDRANVSGSGAGDSIINSGSNATVDGGEGDDYILNYGARVTLDGGLGNDLLENAGGNQTSMLGGEGDDTIINDSGNRATLEGGWGDDRLVMTGAETFATINYISGDGRDTIDGFDRYKVLRIVGGTIDAHHSLKGGDYIISIGGGSIRLTDVGIKPIQVLNSDGKISAINYDISNYAARAAISGTSDGDWIFNATQSAIVNGFDGDDLIYNWGVNSRFNGGVGNDTIVNLEQGATITGGDGADSIINEGRRVTISAGDGDDSIENAGDQVTMLGGDGNDLIRDSGAAVIRAGAGNDTVVIDGGLTRLEYVSGDEDDVIVGLTTDNTIRLVDGSLASHGYVGDDYLIQFESRTNTGSILVKDAGLTPIRFRDVYGKMDVLNYDVHSTVDATMALGTDDDDKIFNEAVGVTVLALDGNDTIFNTGSDSTLDGGDGDDLIDLHSARSVVKYSSGDDTIVGLGVDDTVAIEYGDWYATMRSGADVIVELENGTMLLRDVTDDELNIVGGTYGKSIVNALNNRTLSGTTANDTIENSGRNVVIVGGDGNDLILSAGANTTIDAGAGDDTLELTSARSVIKYAGGSDVIVGFDYDDTLRLDDFAYTTMRSGDDVIVSIGNGSMNLVEAARRTIHIAGGFFITDNYIVNTSDQLKVVGTDGADYILNYGAEVTIEGGTGDDTFVGSEHGQLYLFSSAQGNNVIKNFGVSDTLRCTAGKIVDVMTVGDDALVSLKGTRYSGSVKLEGAGGSRFDWSSKVLKLKPINEIVNAKDRVKVIGSDGDDSIVNYGLGVTIEGGTGDDTFVGSEQGQLYLFSSAQGNNVIKNFGVSDTLRCTAGKIVDVMTVGNDALVSLKGTRYSGSVKLEGAGGSRFDWSSAILKLKPINEIVNAKDGLKVFGSDGDDSIVNYGLGVTIEGGTGDDTFVGSEQGQLYLFSSAQGNNVIKNFGVSDTLRCTAGKIVDVMTVGDDAIVSLKGTRYSGTVMLEGAGDYNFDWSASVLKVPEDYWFLAPEATLNELSPLMSEYVPLDPLDQLALDEPLLPTLLDTSARSDPTLASTTIRHRTI